MSARDAEVLWARLLSDPALRERFLADPQREAVAAGLTPEEARSFEKVDREGLAMAGQSFDAKRMHAAPARRNSLVSRLRRMLQGSHRHASMSSGARNQGP
jgi:hypothetical protein